MKREANMVAIIITVFAWVIGMFFGRLDIGWAIMIATFAVMKLCGWTYWNPKEWS